MTELRPALFLDRDGVLNEEVNYLHDPRDLVMIPGSACVIAECNRRAIPVIVVTNQAGIGRGYYDEAAYLRVNAAMIDQLATEGARIDAWYFCPHHPGANCECRKPKPGMLVRAAEERGLALSQSALVGDKTSDLVAGRAAGLKNVLARTGYGAKEEQELIRQGQQALFDFCIDRLGSFLPYLAQVFGAPK